MTRAAPIFRSRARFIATGLFILSLAALAGIARADTIVRGFKTQASLQPGWVVAIDKNTSDSVVAAPAGDASRIYGVVIDPSQAPATVARQGQQVFVANSGTYPTLVSLSGGPINPGDFISISTTDGIGAKANSDQSYILGQALEEFDGKGGVITTSPDGFAIGRIAVSITPGKNPLLRTEAAVPTFLKKVAQGIAGTDKNLTAARIWAAVGVFIVCLLVAFSVLWVGIRSGMVAIGRNPLSRHSIMQSLVQVIVVSALVLIAGMFGVYLLLRL